MDLMEVICLTDKRWRIDKTTLDTTPRRQLQVKSTFNSRRNMSEHFLPSLCRQRILKALGTSLQFPEAYCLPAVTSEHIGIYISHGLWVLEVDSA